MSGEGKDIIKHAVPCQMTLNYAESETISSQPKLKKIKKINKKQFAFAPGQC